MKLIKTIEFPSKILSKANAYVNSLRDSLAATAVVAFYHLRTRVLRFANAAHPPPLLVGTDEFHFLTYSPSDAPLGVVAQHEFQDHSIVIPSDALVVFYTDGFTEHTRGIAQGEQELVEAVHEMRAHASPQAARTIAEHIFQEKPHLDDAALMVLRTTPNTQAEPAHQS